MRRSYVKYMALGLFVILPFLAFFLGRTYQSSLSQQEINSSSKNDNKREEIIFANNVLHYIFTHTDREIIAVHERPNEFTPENSESIRVLDNTNVEEELMTVQPVTTTVNDQFTSEIEALKQIVDYHSSSLGMYMSPELNTVNGPTTRMLQGVNYYKYEIDWEINPADGTPETGTDVWLFTPTFIDNDLPYNFLWIKYDKKNEKRVEPIIDSFTLSQS